MKNVYLYPYNNGSKSAKALCETLDIVQIKTENSKFKPSKAKIVINWGSPNVPVNILAGCYNVLNKDISVASNKLKYFNAIAGEEYCAPFTTNKDEAAKWIDEGREVVCRTVLNGHSGQGIVIASKKEELVDAPLYVLYIKKQEEYRVHVHADYGAFFVQRKARKHDVPDDEVNWKVRNHDNGFVFAHQDVKAPECVFRAAKQAVRKLGLDFGAVDVLYNSKYEKAYAIEVNTAPGIEGATLDAYVEMFKGVL